MEELIAHLALAGETDAGKARQAATIVLGFLLREGPRAETTSLFAKIPGAAEMAEGGKVLRGGLFGVFNELSALGLGLGQIRAVAGALLRFAEEKAGKETVRAVVGRIPGLAQLV